MSSSKKDQSFSVLVQALRTRDPTKLIGSSKKKKRKATSRPKEPVAETGTPAYVPDTVDLTVLIVNYVGTIVESRFIPLSGDYTHLSGTYMEGSVDDKALELKSILDPVSGTPRPKIYKAFPLKSFRKAKIPKVVIASLITIPIRGSDADDDNTE